MPFGRVVGRNGFHQNITHLHLVTVFHHLSITNHFRATRIGDELGFVISECGYGFLVEVVAVFVGYEDVVSLRHRGVISSTVAKFADGINLNFLSIINNADAGMHQGIELDGLAALGEEGVNLRIVGSHFLSCFLPGEDASFKICHLETVLNKDVGGGYRATSTAAIDGYTTALIELLQSIFLE